MTKSKDRWEYKKAYVNRRVDRLLDILDELENNPSTNSVDEAYKTYEEILRFYEGNDVTYTKLYRELYESWYPPDNYNEKLEGMIFTARDEVARNRGGRFLPSPSSLSLDEYKSIVEDVSGIVLREKIPKYFHEVMKEIKESIYVARRYNNVVNPRSFLKKLGREDIEKLRDMIELYRINTSNLPVPYRFKKEHERMARDIEESHKRDAMMWLGIGVGIEMLLYYLGQKAHGKIYVQAFLALIGLAVAGFTSLAVYDELSFIKGSKEFHLGWDK